MNDRHSQLDAFRGMGVSWLLDQWVERHPDKTFVVWAPFDGDERRWSYAELADEASPPPFFTPPQASKAVARIRHRQNFGTTAKFIFITHPYQ